MKQLQKNVIKIVSVILIIYGVFAFWGNTASRHNFEFYKLYNNNHGAVLTKLTDLYFRKLYTVGEYNYLGGKITRINEEPDNYDEEGKAQLEFKSLNNELLTEANNKVFSVSILYYDKKKNIKKTYDAVCNRKKLENCTAILVDKSILNYPPILDAFVVLLKKPCEYLSLFPEKDKAGINRLGCNSSNDVFGKILLGIVNEKAELFSVIVISKANISEE